VAGLGAIAVREARMLVLLLLVLLAVCIAMMAIRMVSPV
jgi:hypothetical protein